MVQVRDPGRNPPSPDRRSATSAPRGYLWPFVSRTALSDQRPPAPEAIVWQGFRLSDIAPPSPTPELSMALNIEGGPIEGGPARRRRALQQTVAHVRYGRCHGAQSRLAEVVERALVGHEAAQRDEDRLSPRCLPPRVCGDLRVGRAVASRFSPHTTTSGNSRDFQRLGPPFLPSLSHAGAPADRWPLSADAPPKPRRLSSSPSEMVAAISRASQSAGDDGLRLTRPVAAPRPTGFPVRRP